MKCRKADLIEVYTVEETQGIQKIKNTRNTKKKNHK